MPAQRIIELPRWHQAPVLLMYPSPDGKRLVSVDTVSHVVLWNTETWKKVCEWDHETGVNHLDWASDSQHLAMANKTNLTIHILRLPTTK